MLRMPAGDAQRAWFPEMLEELVAWWKPGVSWESLAEFCRRMTERRAAIRQERGIQGPLVYCPKCDRMERMTLPDLSIRSALFALKKAGALSEEEMREVDRSWKSYQRENQLDAYGKKKQTDDDPGQTHGHS